MQQMQSTVEVETMQVESDEQVPTGQVQGKAPCGIPENQSSEPVWLRQSTHLHSPNPTQSHSRWSETPLHHVLIRACEFQAMNDTLIYNTSGAGRRDSVAFCYFRPESALKTMSMLRCRGCTDM